MRERELAFRGAEALVGLAGIERDPQDSRALEFAFKDGKYYGIDLTNYTPDLDYRSLKDAHFPWAVERMAEFAVEKALSNEPTPSVPDFRSLMLR